MEYCLNHRLAYNMLHNSPRFDIRITTFLIGFTLTNSPLINESVFCACAALNAGKGKGVLYFQVW